MCETACPVHINTGDLVRFERANQRNAWQRRLALFAADHIDVISGMTRFALRLARFAAITHLPRTVIPLPPPAAAMPEVWPIARSGAPTLLYFPSCLGRMLGPDSLPAALAACCDVAGVGLVVPDGINNLCCGQPFASKGFPEAATVVLRRTLQTLLAHSKNHLIVITDTSTCAGQWDNVVHVLTPAEHTAWSQLRRLSPAEVISEVLVPRLTAEDRLTPASDPCLVHPTCSEFRHGWISALSKATAAVGTPIIPTAASCCGMAGDKGWVTPALTASASAREASEAAHSSASVGITTSTTCALALSAASGRQYQHAFLALQKQLKPARH
jgi:D-lactate dehydrogenase